tara:strand:- start:88503 stop:88736 length:234 start_codon:yes stop_codon:yes gene_type:complete
MTTASIFNNFPGDIAPIELAARADIVLPAVLELPKLRISKKQIEAFKEIDHAHDILCPTTISSCWRKYFLEASREAL